ncbi:MAG TPA: poly-gamma-glutamate synthase PgsB [bacterium]|nr:poly-gamma-glutamate synthase PgsB [bacterium]
MTLVFLLAMAFLVYGVAEYRFHLANLRTIPIRVHVNGTRGKSSVARLIAAGLRAGGIRTVAKTTGSAARYIHPDGAEEPVSRPGPPNIREQLAIVRRARREGAGALVLECMAIRPDLQRICEHMIAKATVGVITNARPDHLDVMGPTVDDVAVALSGTVPDGGVLFTSEHERVAAFEAEARARGTKVHEILPEASDEGLTEGFRYVEHLENVALALAVCEHLGVPTDTAVRGMREATPDPGALFVHRIREGGKEIEFVSAFAANDRDSTVAIWNALNPHSDPDRTVIVVASMRADRPDRAFQFGEIIADDLPADHYILAGGMTHPVKSIAKGRGLDVAKIHDLGGKSAEEVFRKVAELTRDRAIVVGVGNIGGSGGEILSLFRERSERE